jgi:melibiose permease
MIFFPLLRKFMNTMKIFYVSFFMAMAGYVVLLGLAFTGMDNVYLLLIPAFLIMSAIGMLNVVVTVFLANTCDYGELKNNRRDESVIFSMQTFVVKLASGIAAFAASICLSINNLKSDAVTEAEKSLDFSLNVAQSAKIGLRMTMSLIPVVVLFIAIFYFKKKFILDEKKMEEISKELENKSGSAVG